MNKDQEPFDLARYEQGIAYESLRDSINSEIARHLAAVDEQPTATDTDLHQAAIAKLVSARQRLSPTNRDAIEIASLIMDSYRDKVPAEAR